MQQTSPQEISDLFIIGGGINGCGIARDAAGRGLDVVLVEQGDLGHATSSASTKLFHGGLRYLEYLEFRLVREALAERETLLRAMPHISWPMRFVLPYSADMRFEKATPTSRLLTKVMPWLKGRRPAWLIRLGLFLYDTLGGRSILRGTTRLDLKQSEYGKVLKPKFDLAWEYSDCWVQDTRLVILNARDAEMRGARILPRRSAVSAHRENGIWRIETTTDDGDTRIFFSRALVNAAGPWVARTINDVIGVKTDDSIRLVRGSHIVVPKLYDHDRCYFLQGEDGRIIFAIPYENDFTLIGTTDHDHHEEPDAARCTQQERDYLCAFASGYFNKPVRPEDVIWTYSGVRPLYNDGSGTAQAATRDYVLRLDDNGAPLLNIFGGKITTYRRLAEHAMEKLVPFFSAATGPWTAGVALPGGDFPVDGVTDLTNSLQARYPFLDTRWATRLVRTYGTDAFKVLGNATRAEDLGEDFGGNLHMVELSWMHAHEFARTGDDVLWRRTRLGLHLTTEQAARVDAAMQAQNRSVRD